MSAALFLVTIATLLALSIVMTMLPPKPAPARAVDICTVIDINVPVRAVFDEWAEFERYPNFMEGVQEVQVTDHWHMHWRAEIQGKTVEWDTVIDEQIPDKRLAWTAHSDPAHGVILSFKRLSVNRTRLTVEIQLRHKREGDGEGPAPEQVRLQLDKFLAHCKYMLENKGRSTWSAPRHIT